MVSAKSECSGAVYEAGTYRTVSVQIVEIVRNRDISRAESIVHSENAGAVSDLVKTLYANEARDLAAAKGGKDLPSR